MKRYLKMLFCFALAILSMAACKNELLDTPEDEEANQIRKIANSGFIQSPLPDPDKDVNFGLATNYTTGAYPGIGIHHNVTPFGDHVYSMVEVHEEGGSGHKLFYRIGKSNQMDIDWYGSKNYSTGVTPQVAYNGSKIVEVHKSQNNNGLWYMVGEITGPGIIQWGSSIKYDEGKYPSVAIMNDYVVEVHKSQNNDGLWYRVGKVNSSAKTISWGSSVRYGYGAHPRIAINNYGTVVEVHESNNALWYRIGTLNTSAKTISWKSNGYGYTTGLYPSVALTDNNEVIEVHMEGNWLKKKQGTISDDNIFWYSTQKFDSGTKPAIAIAADGSMAVQAHQSANDRTLWATTSLFIDRSTWMTDSYDLLRGKKLKDICLPGTHDSGTHKLYDDMACPPVNIPLGKIGRVKELAKAQRLSIKGQLDAGVRFFDIRPAFKNNQYHTYHTILATKMDEILGDFKNYLNSLPGNSHELVIIRFNKFCFGTSKTVRHAEFVEKVQNALGDYLYDDASGNYADTPFSTFVGNGPRVLIIYQDDISKEKGFVFANKIKDQGGSFSDKVDYNAMRNDQLTKLQSNSKKIFKLCWTLTPDFSTAIDIFDHPTLEELSRQANRNLRGFVAEYGKQYRINILNTDFTEDASATDCAIMLNRH
ncbi:phosphatidylinositol-specific phospholipase C domain-containing protein [Rapidithrix thailandica]|uniref:Phosphatidylinositol-specific phospholipase C domain-containing protein n=1 Tax=Rapidithrix thailandica TaxID=413964 RepID=A0AAW9SH91_9BACT